MKINLLATKYIKGLDIDLKLNSNKNIPEVLKEISTALGSYRKELGLEYSKDNKSKPIYIPDNADIQRVDLKDWKERRNFFDNIRLDNDENTYILLKKDDRINNIVIDGISLTRESLPESLSVTDYVLIVKRKDILENKEKVQKRIETEQSSLELQRTKQKNESFNLFFDEYRKFLKEQKNYNSIVSNIDFTKTNSNLFNGEEAKPPKNLPGVTALELKKDQIWFTDSDPSGSVAYRFTEDFDSFPYNGDPEDGIRMVTAEKINWKTLQVLDTIRGTLSGNGTYYLYTPAEVSKKEKEPQEVEIENFTPEVDIKTLIKKDAVFPANMFPTYGNGELQKIVSRLKSHWNQMIGFLDNLKVSNRDITNLLDKYQESIKSGKREYEEMTFTDKSGYKVDLGKYFDKLASLPLSVPESVKENYNKIFKEVEDLSKKLVEKIKQLLDEEDFSKASLAASILKNNGTKEFNNDFKYFLNEQTWDRNSSRYIKPQVAIKKMEENKKEFFEKVESNSILE